MNDTAGAAHAYAGAFVEELARAGVRHVCIAPGSRSTPLALMIAENRGLRSWMHLDERSCAFFALGMARTLGEPVALLCTSGTAAANFFPAVVEAKSAGVPLVIMTADRPPEMRDVGAAQTIDQNRLYGSHAKWFVEVALPEATPSLLRYVRTLAARAVASAVSVPAGPVHLNFPFREPLVPVPSEPPPDASEGDLLAWNGRPDAAPWVSVQRSPAGIDPNTAQRIRRSFATAARPLIVCGPQHDVALGASLTSFASALGAPVLADPLSQLRWGPHDRGVVIDRYDAFLRHAPTSNGLTPDFVLRVGGVPTSKALLQFLERHSSVAVTVIDETAWPDPTLLTSEMVRANPRVAIDALSNLMGSDRVNASRSSWFASWADANDRARCALDQFRCSLAEPFEGNALADVVACLPDRATLFVSSSMPVRDLDAFASGDERDLRILANRGANGIDGVVSTALGAAAALDNSGPLVLVIGDLALYHDMNGLLAAKLHGIDITIVVLNNDGGGIFSFLPQASHGKHFEKLFGTPHGLDFEPVASLYGATYRRVTDSSSLRDAVNTGIGGGFHLIEMRTERVRNVALHREAFAAVAAELERI